jgi:hypothetical protein
MSEINPADLRTYTAHEVASLADLDWQAVRDEGARRQDIAEKRIARLSKQLADAQKEMAEAHLIINAAHKVPQLP